VHLPADDPDAPARLRRRAPDVTPLRVAFESPA
jgi:hypothetical protein